MNNNSVYSNNLSINDSLERNLLFKFTLQDNKKKKSNLAGGSNEAHLLTMYVTSTMGSRKSLEHIVRYTRFSRVISPACLLPSRGGGRVPKTISGRATFLFLTVPRMTAQEGSGDQTYRKDRLCRPPSKRSVLFEAGTIE